MMELWNTRLYEISSKATRGGKRPIKFILHRIMDSPEDYQENGISWKEEYVAEALKTIVNADIAAEYISKGNTADDTEIGGHGYTGDGTDADGLPIPTFNEDSEVIGTITGASIETLEIDGAPTRVAVAEGVLYEHRHKGLVEWLKQNVPLGNVMGSVEIVGTPENNNQIVYEDGYKPKGRVPMQYEYAGYAILSARVQPADDAAHVLEINNKEEAGMNEEQVRALVDEVKTEFRTVFDENAKLTNEINSMNDAAAAKDAELNEANAKVADLEAALEQVRGELNALREEDERRWQERNKEFDELLSQKNILEKEIAEYKVAERLAELNKALEPFSEERQAYAAAQIDAFKADPINGEINTIVDTICLAIGKEQVKAEQAAPEAPAAEQNSKKEDQPDFGSIFAEVAPETTPDPRDIF